MTEPNHAQPIEKQSLMRTLAISNDRLPRFLRSSRQAVLNFGLPRIPRVLLLIPVSPFLFLREIYYFLMRVFICEPFFKAHCATYGRNLHTDVFLHWIQGRGEIIVGDNVLIGGKCSFGFAARFSDKPTLILGDNVEINHGCTFTIGKKIVIGRNCLIASEVWIVDSSGHPLDPVARMARLPPLADSVKPVTIEENVWIGRRAIILPGVTIGHGSIVGAGAVVTKDVPPNTMVAGNPAQQKRKLASPGKWRRILRHPDREKRSAPVLERSSTSSDTHEVAGAIGEFQIP